MNSPGLSEILAPHLSIDLLDATESVEGDAQHGQSEIRDHAEVVGVVHLREQHPRALFVLSEEEEVTPGRDEDGPRLPLVHDDGKATVDHHLTQVVRVAGVFEEAI